MREYSFNLAIAEAHGVDEAIFVHATAFWIKKNRANNKNYHDGRWWTYNTIAALEKLFPFWTKKQITRVTASCKNQGILFTGNYNANRQDRTIWYALSDEILTVYDNLDCLSDEAKKALIETEECNDTSISPNGEMPPKPFPQMGTCISPNGEILYSNSYHTQLSPIVPTGDDAHFKLFWDTYPRKIDKQRALKAFQKLHPSPQLLEQMLKALENQKKSPQWVKDGGAYIPHPTTWLNNRRWEIETSPVPTEKAKQLPKGVKVIG